MDETSMGKTEDVVRRVTPDVQEGQKKYVAEVKRTTTRTVEVVAWSAEQARHLAANGDGVVLASPAASDSVVVRKVRLVETLKR